MITLTAFKWVPPFAQGLVRDLRVRWALEEAGVPYRLNLIGQGDQDTPEYRALQPFGQVPVIEEDGLVLFESGAILLRIAEQSEALSPRDEAGKAKVAQWVIAALNSVEPHVQNLTAIDLFHADQDWAKARRPGAEAFLKLKLDAVGKRLKAHDYLEDRFTAGDLMMISVLRNLRHTDLISADPVLGPYVARGEARPAFKKALADQLAVFAAHEPQLEPA
jgi:glutathione S-transferase